MTESDSRKPRNILVSNRLPVMVSTKGKNVRIIPSTGGLATGLRSPHEESGGTWIGWPGDLHNLPGAERVRIESELSLRRLKAVHLSASEIDRFYHGYSNGIIWPLFHYLIDKLPLDSPDWDIYHRVNLIFAEAVRECYADGDLIWVHDYHLMLLPQLLREMLPRARIGFFLHIPFPSSEILRILPKRSQVLRGLLGADLIGFHTPSYMRHFSVSVLRFLGIEANVDRISYQGRDVHLGVYPMGIDAKTFDSYADDPVLRAEANAIRQESDGAKILLGVDRLDYTKGILRRLMSFGKLLEKNPQLRGRVRLLQVATPSRTEVKVYQSFKSQVDGLVGSINGKHGTARYVPVHYLNRALSQRDLSSLYMAADVMVVTPLRDGLNLVAKEYIACRKDLDGVLVLSEFAGVSSELSEALIVNPYDLDGVAEAFVQALGMDPREKAARMKSMRERICRYDVHRWAGNFLEDLASVSPNRASTRTEPSSPETIAGCLDRALAAGPVVYFLDYDGTLVPLRPHPDEAVPDGALMNLLEELASRPGTEVHILSGRTKDFLDRWLGNLPIHLHAEHGLWSRPLRSNDWTCHITISDAWKAKIRPLFQEVTKSTPGSFIEEKTAGMVWHYRRADPVQAAAQAKELRILLFELLSNIPVQVIAGEKIVEVRPQGIDKGTIVRRVLGGQPEAPFMVAFGDDRTDEDLFAALPEGSIAIHVGPLPSLAPYRLVDSWGVRAFLTGIIQKTSRGETPSGSVPEAGGGRTLAF